LLERHATVTLAHSRTADLAAEVGAADVLVAAVGKAEMIRGAWVKPGATVIDVGINRNAAGKLVGDVEFRPAAETAGAITPGSGGLESRDAVWSTPESVFPEQRDPVSPAAALPG